MTAEESMETQEDNGPEGKDGDTEEFSEGELALCVEQSWSNNEKRGSGSQAWARLGQFEAPSFRLPPPSVLRFVPYWEFGLPEGSPCL
jgi:hypothetical protein